MRTSLASKFTQVCKTGRIEQLHLSQLDPILHEYFIGFIAKDYIVFKFMPLDNSGVFTQAVKNADDFIKNVYSLYCIN